MDDNTSCSLLKVLSQLRQSSLESVDSAAEFAEHNSYMHISRDIEDDLRALLKQVNESNHKNLIILTGSAGDGKSHLISYLKNKDPERLLEGYSIINDATESDHPAKTAIETLATKLRAFSDEELTDGKADRMILAVNLGMLNNFINSPDGKFYSKLKAYLDKIDVFTGALINKYDPQSFFHTISFSDYQVFSLVDGKYDDKYLLDIFSKITSESKDNYFNQAYKNCLTCPVNSKCPLMANYKFFSREDVQKVIAFRIIQSVIEEKTIITMREIQNFIYEILVSPDFSENYQNELNLSKEEILKRYLHGTLPFLLYKGKSHSILAENIRKNDPLSSRSQQQDDEMIHLYSLNSLKKYASQIDSQDIFKLFNVVNEDFWDNLKGDLRSVFIDYMLLYKYSQELVISDNFSEYVKFLYYFYLGRQKSGKSTELAPLIRLTSNVIQKWYGNFGEDRMCFDTSLKKYWLLEEVDLNLKQVELPAKLMNSPIVHFQPEIELYQTGQKENTVSIDYSLFMLLKAVNSGNNPTMLERNNYIDFDRFIRRVLESGSLKNKIFILPKESEQNSSSYRFRYNGDYYTFTRQ